MTFQDRLNSWLGELGDTAPKMVGAILILILGYLVAKLLQRLTRNLLKRTGLDNRIAGTTSGTDSVSPEKALSKLVFFVVMLFALMATLDTLGLQTVLDPLKEMGAKFINTLPGIIGASIIGFMGYIIAKVVSGLVAMGTGVLENISRKAGLDHEIDLAGILKTIVFALVFIPFLVAALDAVGLDAITAPVQDMLAQFLSAIPNILAAAIIIGAFYIGGRFLSGLLKDLLTGLQLDNIFEQLGISGMIGKDTNAPSLIANIAFFFVMFLGVVTGVEQLGLERFNALLTNIFELTGQIAFGMLILLVGNYLANLAYSVMSKGETDEMVAKIAKVVVIALFLAIALRTMGIANDIVNLAFGLSLGAVAVAFALSFGLGGREAAGSAMKRFLDRMK